MCIAELHRHGLVNCPLITVLVTVVTLEGPSGVGKTTIASAICETESAVRVPEVNELFDTTQEDSTTWYYERQCDRWRRALELEDEYDVVILDGDVFQPLWYNWSLQSLPDEERTIEQFASVETIADFYRPILCEQDVGFPDRYCVLTADEQTLQRRKTMDETRTRHNFETHLKLNAPQRRYWEYLQSIAPNLLRFIDAVSITETGAQLQRDEWSEDDHDQRWSVEQFDALVDWLNETSPTSSSRRSHQQ